VNTIGEAPTAELQQVTPGYFITMGLSLLEGRFLDRADDEGASPVVVVNEAFLRHHWPGVSAVGHRVRLFSSTLPWMEIVGVVRDERQGGLLVDPRPKMYVPYSQMSSVAFGPEGTMNLVVHGQGVERLAGPIRSIVTRMNSAVPVYNVQTMEAVKAGAMTDHSYPTMLLTVFGLFALFLASIGIYGLVAFNVNQGRHDIGVHVALGATASQVRRMVMGRGLLPVFVGLALGLAGAVGGVRLLDSLLYEVDPIDPPVYLGVCATLLLVAGTASLVPAVRASRLDPVEVLRSE